MYLGETMSKSNVNKILKAAGYIYGTVEYQNERSRCFKLVDDGRYLEEEAVTPVATRLDVHIPRDGGFHTGSPDVT